MSREFDIFYIDGERITYIECEGCQKEIKCLVDCDVMPQDQPIENDRGDYPIIPDVCPHCGEKPVFDLILDKPEDFHSDG